MSEYAFEKTSRSGVETSDGFIPFYWQNGVRLAVKIDWNNRTSKGVPAMTKNGYLVYATPGGGEWISQNKLSDNVTAR